MSYHLITCHISNIKVTRNDTINLQSSSFFAISQNHFYLIILNNLVYVKKNTPLRESLLATGYSCILEVNQEQPSIFSFNLLKDFFIDYHFIFLVKAINPAFFKLILIVARYHTSHIAHFLWLRNNFACQFSIDRISIK